MKRWLVASALLGLAYAAHAQTSFKCQDKNGQIVYVDRACGVYGLRDVGAVKDRVTVAPARPLVEYKESAAVPSAEPGGDGIPRGVEVRDPARERAVKRCKESRGADCESNAGLDEWLRQDRPITDDERQAAVAARHLRELCAKTNGTDPACADLPADP